MTLWGEWFILSYLWVLCYLFSLTSTNKFPLKFKCKSKCEAHFPSVDLNQGEYDCLLMCLRKTPWWWSHDRDFPSLPEEALVPTIWGALEKIDLEMVWPSWKVMDKFSFLICCISGASIFLNADSQNDQHREFGMGLRRVTVLVDNFRSHISSPRPLAIPMALPSTPAPPSTPTPPARATASATPSPTKRKRVLEVSLKSPYKRPRPGNDTKGDDGAKLWVQNSLCDGF